MGRIVADRWILLGAVRGLQRTFGIEAGALGLRSRAVCSLIRTFRSGYSRALGMVLRAVGRGEIRTLRVVLRADGRVELRTLRGLPRACCFYRTSGNFLPALGRVRGVRTFGVVE